MRFRRKSQQMLMNIAPEGYWCPACGSRGLSSKSAGWGRIKCRCGECGLSFTASSGMSDEDYAEACERPEGPISIDWKECASPMDAVRRFAVHIDPNLTRYAADSDVFAWICDYWDYVKWNEHGNELSYDELAFDGGFADIIREVVFDPTGIIEYLGGGEKPDKLSDREKDLIAGVRKINRRFSA